MASKFPEFFELVYKPRAMVSLHKFVNLVTRANVDFREISWRIPALFSSDCEPKERSVLRIFEHSESRL